MRKLFVVAALGVAAVACEQKTSKETVVEQPRPVETTAAPAAAKWTDGNVLATITAINQGEVDIGNAAMAKLGNKDAKDFCDMMVKDHGEGVKKLSTIATEQQLTPMDNETTTAMRMEGATLVTKMSADPAGPAYDKAYMQAMVDGHQKALNAIDQKLLPNATNPALKDTITAMRGKVQEHLSRAQSVLQGLPSS
jgi:putative membrane protein